MHLWDAQSLSYLLCCPFDYQEVGCHPEKKFSFLNGVADSIQKQIPTEKSGPFWQGKMG